MIAHQAVLRALYAYMMDRPPHMPVHRPLHTILSSPTAYGCDEERIVSWVRDAKDPEPARADANQRRPTVAESRGEPEVGAHPVKTC
jgi:broad specificity phosphatase PhoE